jgi:hypothetical protein
MQDAARDWQALRADGAIQYAPVAPPAPPKPLEWVKGLSDLLQTIFEPLGRFLGMSGQAVMYALLALVALLVLYIVWRLVIEPMLELRGRSRPDAEPEWAPDRAAAVALLEDADRLAAEGRYGEAAHLLLQRSVHHIAEARPDWLLPASTAREIASFPMLPERARQAFSAIATRVERSLFALRDLDAGDWQAARQAYADFALQRFAAA